MEIITLKLSEITPDPGNAKEHPEEQIKQIMESIERFGNDDPIAVWGDSNLSLKGRIFALHAKGGRFDSAHGAPFLVR